MKFEYHSKAVKLLGKQENKVTIRIVSAISKLPAGDVRKMEGYKHRYRLRIGRYRAIFSKSFVIDEETKERICLIKIWDIDNRGDIY